MLSDFKSAFEKYLPDWFQLEKSITDLYNKWEAKMKDGTSALGMYRNVLIKEYKKTAEEADAIINGMYSKMSKALWDDLAKQYKEELEKEFYNMDRETSAWVAKINSQFESEKLYLGIDLPEDALRHFNDIFEKEIGNVKSELDMANEKINKFYNSLAGEGEPLFGKTEEEIGKLYPEFQKLLDKRNNLEAESNRLRIENFKATSEIISNEIEKELSLNEKIYDSNIYWLESYYAEQEALSEKKAAWSLGTTQAFENQFKREK